MIIHMTIHNTHTNTSYTNYYFRWDFWWKLRVCCGKRFKRGLVRANIMMIIILLIIIVIVIVIIIIIIIIIISAAACSHLSHQGPGSRSFDSRPCVYIYIYIHVYVTIIYIYMYIYIYIHIYVVSIYIRSHLWGVQLLKHKERRRTNAVGFHNFNLRIFNLRVSNPSKLIVDVFLTRCRISMCQSLGPKKTRWNFRNRPCLKGS